MNLIRSRHLLPQALVAACLIVITADSAPCATITLQPTYDAYTEGTTVFDLPFLRTGNTEVQRIQDEPPPGRKEFRTVMVFDVSSIPSNAIVDKVTFGIVQQEFGYGGLNGLEQLLGLAQAWDASDALAMHNAVAATGAQGGTATILDGNFSCQFCAPGPATTPNAPGLIQFDSMTQGSGAMRGFVQGWIDGSRPNYGLGIRQGQEGFGRTGRQFVSTNVQTPLLADANFDGVVTVDDLSILVGDFGNDSTNDPLSPADFNFDRFVDELDVQIWIDDYQNTAGVGPGPLAPFLTIEYRIAEPATAGLSLAALGLGACWRRRRGV